MRGNQFWYDDINNSYTDERYLRGTMRDQPIDEIVAGSPVSPAAEGDRTWVFVLNDEAATAFAQGTCVARDTSDYNDWDGILVAVADTIADGILGAAQYAIAGNDGTYGWIGRRGFFDCISDGTFVAGRALVPSTTGGNGRWGGIAAITLAAADVGNVCGHIQDTQATGGSLGTAVLSLSA